MPACSPAATRLQYKGSNCSGYFRNACESELPVSTSALISSNNLPTAGLSCPRPTISKVCSSGTPAFIIVANWRVNSVISLSVICRPPLKRCWKSC
jgi:hypothetical protein